MPTERPAIARLALSAVATVGLAIASVVWSESWFWARWRPEDSALGLLETLLVYALAVQVVRFVASRWRVAASESGAWQRVLLAGALYGWLVEGIVVTTVIDDLPLTLSYTGLAWHALFTVLLGWWWMPRQLDRPLARSIVPLMAVGVGVGAWASFWRFEEGAQTPVLDYALFVTASTVAYGVGLAIWWRFRSSAEPGLRGSVIAIAALALLAVLHGIDNPLTLIGVALVGLALLALIHTTPRVQTAPATEVPLLATAGPAPYRSLWRLVLIPVVATAIFALFAASPDPIPSGWLFYLVTVPAGAALFALAWWWARRSARRRQSAATWANH